MTAKKIKRKEKKKLKTSIPFGKENYILFFIGLLLIVLGYIFMAQGPADSFWSLTLAPILLIFSYCIVIPISIIYRKKSAKPEQEVNPTSGG
ncbi:MAG: hypothetical protein SCK70_10895 [bacterium]|nr:hypothetical protein [bacterium]